MPSWEPYTENWEQWQEALPSGKHMTCYRHPDGYEWPTDNSMSGGWVIIKPDEGCRFGDEIEKNKLPRECGWLEIECIMHEMRIKYG